MTNHRLLARALVAGGAVVAATLLAGGANAQQFGQQIFSPEATLWGAFGDALVSDATTLVVGAPESIKNHDSSNCGLSGYGAIAVYKKSNGTWNFAQSFWHDYDPMANEDRFGTSLSLRGNTLVVSAPRENDGGVTDAGAFLVYTRPSAAGSFSKLGTYFSPSPNGGRMGAITGVATNGSFIADGEQTGPIHIYQLQNGVVSYRYDVSMPVQAPATGLYITDNGVLVANLPGWATLIAYQLGASNYTTLNVSALSLPYATVAGTAFAGSALAGDGNTVFALLNTDSATTLSTQVVNFTSSTVGWVDTRVIPTALVPRDGSTSPVHLTIKEGAGFFASFGHTDASLNLTTFALGYRYTPNSGSGHDYNFQGTFLPRDYTNLANGPNPESGLTFNGTDLVVGDDNLTQASGGCASRGGLDTFTLGPTTVPGPGASNKEEPWITPSAGLGAAVADYGSYAVVASGYSGGEPGLEGQVTLFKHGSQWEALERYVEDYGEAFGESVAIDQYSLLIGAPSGGSNYTGVVYVANAITNGYQHGLLKQTLPLPTDTPSGGDFGTSLSVDDTTLIVGAALGGPIGDGSAYIYTWNASAQTWLLAQELQPPSSDVVWGISFGASVAISGDWAVVGAPLLSRNGLIDAGGVYVYHRVNGTFSYVQRLIASNSSNVDDFGESLAINGSNIAASGKASGVHLFHLGTTTFASDGAISVSGQQIVPVALSSSGLVVATQSDARVRRYTRSGTSNWPLAGTLAGPTGESFGSSLALQATNVLIGAPTSQVGNFVTGASYSIQFGSF